jgi:hypothetical protein
MKEKDEYLLKSLLLCVQGDKEKRIKYLKFSKNELTHLCKRATAE